MGSDPPAGASSVPGPVRGTGHPRGRAGMGEGWRVPLARGRQLSDGRRAQRPWHGRPQGACQVWAGGRAWACRVGAPAPHTDRPPRAWEHPPDLGSPVRGCVCAGGGPPEPRLHSSRVGEGKPPEPAAVKAGVCVGPGLPPHPSLQPGRTATRPPPLHSALGADTVIRAPHMGLEDGCSRGLCSPSLSWMRWVFFFPQVIKMTFLICGIFF